MKEIIEIIVTSLTHLTPEHIQACAHNHMLGNFNYSIKNVKVRNFTNNNGTYNKDGKWRTMTAFRKNLNCCELACYTELIEAELTLVR